MGYKMNKDIKSIYIIFLGRKGKVLSPKRIEHEYFGPMYITLGRSIRQIEFLDKYLQQDK